MLAVEHRLDPLLGELVPIKSGGLRVSHLKKD